MTKQFYRNWLVACLAVGALGACGDDDDDGTATFDAAPGVPDATPGPDAEVKPFCHDPIGGLDPACPEGGEVRMERVIGQQEYRVTSFLKSGQDGDDATPAIVPPDGIPSCVVCDPDSDMWACRQATNRVYEQAGQLTISDGTATDLVVDHCSQGSFAMGAYLTDECDTDPGTCIAVDAFNRDHPDGAYIAYGPFADTPVASADNLMTFSFAGDDNGYPATDFDVYLAPDFTSTPSTDGAVSFNDDEDLVITWDMPAANNLPENGVILMTATFIDTPPTTGEGAPVLCFLGTANPGGGEQSATIPAATVRDMIHTDGVMLRGAINHTLAEYNDGTTRGRRIDQIGMNCYSQPFSKN